VSFIGAIIRDFWGNLPAFRACHFGLSYGHAYPI
jgi:hypothetical protein